MGGGRTMEHGLSGGAGISRVTPGGRCRQLMRYRATCQGSYVGAATANINLTGTRAGLWPPAWSAASHQAPVGLLVAHMGLGKGNIALITPCLRLAKRIDANLIQAGHMQADGSTCLEEEEGDTMSSKQSEPLLSRLSSPPLRVSCLSLPGLA